MAAKDEISGDIVALFKKLPGAPTLAKRVDGWINTLTGLGDSVVDKVARTGATSFKPLSDEVLSSLFHTDPTVRKIAAKPVEEALRLGFDLTMPENAGGVETVTAVLDACDELGVVGALTEAGTWERLFGGSVIYMGIDDGQTSADSQEKPVAENRVRRVLWLRVIDRRYVRPSTRSGDVDTNPLSPTYLEPTHYELQIPNTTATVYVHRSRLVVFPGIATTSEVRYSLQGWGVSSIELAWEALQRNVTAWQSSGNAVANAQYVIYKLKGLSHILGAPNGEATAKTRARAMEMAKSMINAVLIDSDDDYVRENPNFGNLPEMLDRFMHDVAAAVDMPVTLLFGRSPAGMNATGDSDRDNWHAMVNAIRTHRLRPRVERIVGLLLASAEGPTKGKVPEGWRIKWPALRQLSELEEADRRLKTAQADQIWIANEVVLPTEVALSRFRPEGFSTETQIDLEAREAIQKAELEALEEAAKNPPEPPAVPNGNDPKDPTEPDEPKAAE